MKRKRLGQHYLIDDGVVERLIAHARIRHSDRVLEIGTGRGALTRRLGALGASFVGYEIDRDNYLKSLEALEGTKGEVRLGDVFEESPAFDVLVASLPYSESTAFVKWLSVRRFDRAVVVLQDDFVRKIMAPPGDRDYRGISALAQIAFGIRILGRVERASFSPRPRVNSVIIVVTPRFTLTREEVAKIMRLFSIRRRQVDSALSELGMEGKPGHGRRRVYSLTPEEVHEICGASDLQ